jgi:hypothetical protein
MKYKYVNCNPFEVYVPGKRGVSVLFRPGEFSTDEWYSRFVGPRKLSRVPVSEEQNSRQVTASEKGTQTQVLDRTRKKYALVLEEETVHYVRKSGIYFCKHCDLFRTGSIKALQIHLREFHQMDVTLGSKVLVETNKDSDEVVVRTSRESVQKVSEEEKVLISSQQPSTSTPFSPTPELSAEQLTPASESSGVGDSQKTFQCDMCEKKFASERGLAIHKSRNH